MSDILNFDDLTDDIEDDGTTAPATQEEQDRTDDLDTGFDELGENDEAAVAAPPDDGDDGDDELPTGATPTAAATPAPAANRRTLSFDDLAPPPEGARGGRRTLSFDDLAPVVPMPRPRPLAAGPPPPDRMPGGGMLDALRDALSGPAPTLIDLVTPQEPAPAPASAPGTPALPIPDPTVFGMPAPPAAPSSLPISERIKRATEGGPASNVVNNAFDALAGRPMETVEPAPTEGFDPTAPIMGEDGRLLSPQEAAALARRNPVRARPDQLPIPDPTTFGMNLRSNPELPQPGDPPLSAYPLEMLKRLAKDTKEFLGATPLRAIAAMRIETPFTQDHFQALNLLDYTKDFSRAQYDDAVRAVQRTMPSGTVADQVVRAMQRIRDGGNPLNERRALEDYFSAHNRTLEAEHANARAAGTTPLDRDPFQRAAEAVSHFGDSVLAPSRGFEPGKNLATDLAGGAGSMLSGIAVSLIPVIGVPTAAGLFTMAGMGEAAENAKRAGATPEQIQRAARFGTIAGATDVVDIMLPRLGTTGQVAGFIARFGSAAIKGVFAEAGQEGLQEFIQNMIKRGIYNPEQDLLEDVGYNALLGGLLGTTAGGFAALEGRTGAESRDRRPHHTYTNPADSLPRPNEGESPVDYFARMAREFAAENPDNRGAGGGGRPGGPPPGGPVATGAPDTRSIESDAPSTRPQGERAAQPQNPPESPQSTPQNTVSDPDRGLLRGYGYTDDQIDDMAPAERTAELAEARDAGVQPIAGPGAARTGGEDQAPAQNNALVPQPAGDRPEPNALTAQAAELRDPQSERRAVFVPAADMQAQSPQERTAILGAGVPVENFDGQGGTLIARDQRTADAAIKVRDEAYHAYPGASDRAAYNQALIGWLTGSPAATASGEAQPARGTRAAPIKVETPADVAQIGQVVDPDPTKRQKGAENYQMEHIKLHGMDISIETARGGVRTSKDGSWRVPDFPAHYGRVKGTKGADGELFDVFVGNSPQSQTVYVIDQINPQTGKFDEHKAMLGFTSEAEAEHTYERAFSDGSGASRVGAVTPMSVDDFKTWLKEGDTTKALRYKQPRAVSQKPASNDAAKGDTQAANIPELVAYAKSVVGAVVRKVTLVGSQTQGKGADTDLLYELTLIQFPKKMSGERAADVIEGLIEKGVPNFNPDLYDSFFKVGDRYFHLASGAGRAIVENTAYAKEQAGKPTMVLAEAADEKGILPSKNTEQDTDGISTPSADVDLKVNKPAAPKDVPADNKMSSDDAMAQLTDLFNQAGVDPAGVDPKDIATAVEIIEAEGVPAADAFQQAAIANGIEDGIITPDEVDADFGEGVADEAVQTPAQPEHGRENSPEGAQHADGAEAGGVRQEGEELRGGGPVRSDTEAAEDTERAEHPAGAERADDVSDDGEIVRVDNTEEDARPEPLKGTLLNRVKMALDGKGERHEFNQLVQQADPVQLVTAFEKAVGDVEAMPYDQASHASTLASTIADKLRDKMSADAIPDKARGKGKTATAARMQAKADAEAKYGPLRDRVAGIVVQLDALRSKLVAEAVKAKGLEHWTPVKITGGFYDGRTGARMPELFGHANVQEGMTSLQIVTAPRGDWLHVGPDEIRDRLEIVDEEDIKRVTTEPAWEMTYMGEEDVEPEYLADLLNNVASGDLKLDVVEANEGMVVTVDDMSVAIGRNVGELTKEQMIRSFLEAAQKEAGFDASDIVHIERAIEERAEQDAEKQVKADAEQADADRKLRALLETVEAGTDINDADALRLLRDGDWIKGKNKVALTAKATKWLAAKRRPAPAEEAQEDADDGVVHVHDEAADTATTRPVPAPTGAPPPSATGNVLTEAPETGPSDSAKPVKPNAQQNVPSNEGAKDVAAGDRLQDYTGKVIPHGNDDGASKRAFLADARNYLTKVAKVLKAGGFVEHTNKKGKAERAVSVNPGGPAVSGDVSLRLIDADGNGIYATIGATVATGNGGIALMARKASAKDSSGVGAGSPNQWLAVDLTTTELADKLEEIARGRRDVTQRPSVSTPVNQGPSQSQEEQTESSGSVPRGPLAREVAAHHMWAYDEGYARKPRSGNEAEQAAWDRGALDRSNADRTEQRAEHKPPAPLENTVKIDAGDLRPGDRWNGIKGPIIVESVKKVPGRSNRIQATTNDGIKEFDSIDEIYVQRGEAAHLETDIEADTTEQDQAASAENTTVSPDTKADTGTAKPARLEDAGEKIGGARKDAWAGRGMDVSDLADMTGAEIEDKVTKGNVFPQPDWAELVKSNAVTPIAAALMRRAYNNLPASPSTAAPSTRGRRRQSGNQTDPKTYVMGLRLFRRYLETVEEGPAQGSSGYNYLSDGFEKFLNAMPEEEFVYASRDDVRRAIGKAPGRYGWSPPGSLSGKDVSAARDDVANGWPATEEAWQRYYTVEAVTRYDREAGKSVDTGMFRLSRRIKSAPYLDVEHSTREAAIAYAKDMVERLKTKREESKDELPSRPHLDNIVRDGPDYRNGSDVTGQDFIDDFGFRGVEFGNWVAGDERQKTVNLAYDALHDLARVLGIDPKAVSLNGTMALAFGARGKGGLAAAHYESHRLVINMTKLSGAGTLAHEWGHALDHYLGETGSPNPYKGNVQSLSGWRYRWKTYNAYEAEYHIRHATPRLKNAAVRLMAALHNRNETNKDMEARRATALESAKSNLASWKRHLERTELLIREGGRDSAGAKRSLPKAKAGVEWWENRISRMDGVFQPQSIETDFFKQAKKLSGKSGNDGYWARPNELLARSFEAFVFDKLNAEGRVSQYLVQGVEADRYADGKGYKGNPYPAGVERRLINAAYERLLTAIHADDGKVGKASLLRGAEGPLTDADTAIDEVAAEPETKAEEDARFGSAEAEMAAVDEATEVAEKDNAIDPTEREYRLNQIMEHIRRRVPDFNLKGEEIDRAVALHQAGVDIDEILERLHIEDVQQEDYPSVRAAVEEATSHANANLGGETQEGGEGAADGGARSGVAGEQAAAPPDADGEAGASDRGPRGRAGSEGPVTDADGLNLRDDSPGLPEDGAPGNVPGVGSEGDVERPRPAARPGSGRNVSESGSADAEGPEAQGRGADADSGDRGRTGDGLSQEPLDEFDAAFDAAIEENFGPQAGPLSSLEDRARALGAAAFAEGRMAVPAQDPAFQPLLKEASGMQSTLAVLDAWTKGWHAANLAAPVEGVETPSARQVSDTRPTRKVAKSALKNTVASADEAMAALTTLFGGRKVGSMPSFDEDTYAKAKPLFKRAAEKFADAAGDVAELVKRMVGELRSAYNWTAEMLERAKPYLRRFVDEVKTGVVKLTGKDAAVRGKARSEAAKARAERIKKNYVITDEDEVGKGSAKQKVRRNIAAIRLMKEIEDAHREATEEEKRALVHYVGWGAFAQDLFADHKPEWATERAQLRELLTAAEIAAARESTLNAHYTSPEVIRGMWGVMKHLGYKGGRALEPSAGVGHFIGLQPKALAASTQWSAVELDGITGRITKLLYGGADVNVRGFETFERPNAFYDLAISNVPFGNYQITDPKRKGYSIHDYFFVKSLDLVRPGGIVAFITSAYTLDKAADRARQHIARRGEFLGAIRLPGGRGGAVAGNAGTEVTTDIIFLRRRMDGEPDRSQAWMGTKTIPSKDGDVTINEYFAAHPEMMLGEMRKTGSMYREGTQQLEGTTANIEERIVAAGKNLPADAMSKPGQAIVEAKVDEVAADGIKEGAYYVKDGTLYQKRAGVGVEATNVPVAQKAKVEGLIEIRDVLNALLARQAQGPQATGRASEALRGDLNKAYDTFVKAFGPINRTQITESTRKNKEGQPIVMRRMPNLAPFKDDPDAYKVAAIENYDDETDTATKAAVFRIDVLAAETVPEVASEADAMAVSLNRFGRVDIPEIAKLLDISEEEAIRMLGDRVYLDPSGDTWRTAEDYLSGDVVQRLEDARAAALTDAEYQRNVEALEKVQPPPLTRVDIRGQFGAPWIPQATYEQFLNDEVGGHSIKLGRNPLTNNWRIIGGNLNNAAITRWSTGKLAAVKLIEAGFNMSPVRIVDEIRNPDGSTTTVVDAKATEEAQVKVNELRALFTGDPETNEGGWLWSDETRASALEDLYNHSFNRLVAQNYDGSHLTLPGLARQIAMADGKLRDFELRPHQKNAVWRMISKGNTLLAHVVGAGKTFTMIAAGMEQKRLGLIQRPMYVVPNHMLEQFSREFLQAYPGANILVADKDHMTRDNRALFAARIAAEKWDGIVITHDAFGRLGVSDEYHASFIREEIAEMEEAIEAAKREEGKKSPTIKQLEAMKKRRAAKLATLLDKEGKDNAVTFEELGVDFLFVDEAHLFKNLNFITKLTRVKGLAQGDAQRAMGLFLKIRLLEERRPGRSAGFATGTDISNTIAEMFTMQRYLQNDRLREYGIHHFDSWAGTFGQVVTQMELSPDGRTFRETASFSRFVNIPELMALYSEVADIQTADMLNLPRPKLKGGTITVVEAEPSAAEEDYIAQLVERAEHVRGKRAEKGGDNMLKIVSEGRKIATDGRLIFGPGEEFNPNGKVALAVRNMHRIWKEGKDPALAQMIFLDMGVPRSRKAPAAKPQTVEEAEDNVIRLDVDEAEIIASAFNLYADMRERLVELGVPREQIAFIHDANDDIKKARMFQAVRDGDVRFIFGSTGKMGVGTNVQTRLAAMHHIDAPWKPAEVEQRDGRILRQGNLNDEIEIFRYITKRSFDSFMWQTLERKSKFIGQIKAGARGVRIAEDIDDPLPEAAQLKAAASGDPRIMEHAEQSKLLRDLDAQRRSHEHSAARARRDLAAGKERLTALRISLAKTRTDLAKVTDVSGDNFKIDLTPIGAGELTERKAAGEAIVKWLNERANQAWGGRDEILRVGTISGLDAVFVLQRQRTYGAMTEVVARARIQGQLAYDGSEFGLGSTTDPLGTVKRLENLLGGVAQYHDKVVSNIKELDASLPKIEAQAKAGAFPKDAQYREAARRVAELEAALKEKPKDKQGEPAKPDDDIAAGFRSGGTSFTAPAKAAFKRWFGKSKTDTAAFERWFGKSKMVDENGAPKVFYHGSGSEFETFSTARGTDYGVTIRGAYFSEDPGLSSVYAEERFKTIKGSQQVYAVYLKIENPMVIDRSSFWQAVREKVFRKESRTTSSMYLTERDVERLKAKGYDGIVNKVWNEVVVFEPTQVKSAIGNDGSYDPANPSMLHSGDDSVFNKHAPIFYSAVERAVEALPFKETVAARWIARIRNGEGVKAEELEWLGLDAWLKAQTGAVTREAVLDYIRANRIEVKDVERREGGPDSEVREFHDISEEFWNGLNDRERLDLRSEFMADAAYRVPGAERAKAYNVGEQVESISSEREFDGSYRITIFPKGYEAAQASGAPRGWASTANVEPKTLELTESKLPDYLGKDLADKIIAHHRPDDERYYGHRVWSGLDLRVGGEKLAAFYDRELVQKANALTKKYGAKVGRADVLHENDREAFRRAQHTGDSALIADAAGEARTSVHTLPITPALRDAALNVGFGLFSGKAGPASFADLGPLNLRLLGDPAVPGKHAQDYVLKRGRKTDVEVLLAVNAKGEVIAHGYGNKTGTGLPPTLMAAMVDERQSIVIHHNHPNNTVLSEPDIAHLALPGLAAVWAHGHGGVISRASLTPQARAHLALQGDDPAANLQSLYKMAFEAGRSFYDHLRDAVTHGGLSASTATLLHGHLTNRALHDAGIIDYQSNVDLDDQIAKLNLQPYLRAATSAVRSLFYGEANPAIRADRPAESVRRHPGDMGASFGRPQGAAGRAGSEAVDDRQRAGRDRAQAQRAGLQSGRAVTGRRLAEPPAFSVANANAETAHMREVAQTLVAERGRYQVMPVAQLADGMFQFHIFDGDILIGALRLTHTGKNLLLHMIDVRNPISGKPYNNTALAAYEALPRPDVMRQIKAYFPNITRVMPAPLATPRALPPMQEGLRSGDDEIARRQAVRMAALKATQELGRQIEPGFREDPPTFTAPPRARPAAGHAAPSFTVLPENWRVAWNTPAPFKTRLRATLEAAFLNRRREMQDKHISTLWMQRSAEVATDTETPQNLDMHLAMTLYPNRVGSRVIKAVKDLFHPVMDELAASNITLDEIDDYLKARHVPERNRVVGMRRDEDHQFRQAIDNDDLIGASGYSNQWARDVMDKIEAEGRTADFERAAALYDLITRANKQMIRANGLESEARIDGWDAMYEHYVPLTGFEVEADGVTGAYHGSGVGFDLRGPEAKHALGRFSRADNVLASTLDKTMRTIDRAEHARVGRTIFRWMEANPNPQLYRIGLAEVKPVYNERTGMVEDHVVMTNPMSQRAFTTKIGGKVYYAVIEHDGLLASFKNIGMAKIPGFLRAIGWVTRQLAAYNTARNPEFFITNAIRDIQDAGITLSAEQKDGLTREFRNIFFSGKALWGATLGQLDKTTPNPFGTAAVLTDAEYNDLLAHEPEAVKGYVETASGMWSAPIGQFYEEYVAAGGKITQFGYKDLETIKRELRRELRQRTESTLTKVAKFPLRALNPVSGPVVKGIEAASEITETNTRFAAYVAGRRTGLSKDKAARLALNSTVNFSMRGLATPYAQALYMFLNAGVQGATKTVTMLANSKRFRRFAGVMVMGGMLQALAGLMFSPDDDDDKKAYQRIPYWERERNLIIWLPGMDRPYKLPIAYTIMPFWMLGEQLGLLMSGRIGVAEAAANVLGTAATAWNPVHEEGPFFSLLTWAKMLSPTITDPLIERVANRNWLQRPIHPDRQPWNRDQPASEIYRLGTSPWFIDAAQKLNRMTGGSHFTPGAVDMHPDDLAHAWDYLLGGFGRFIGNTADFARNQLEGVETPAHRVPFLRRLVGEPVNSPFRESEKFYEQLREVSDISGRLRRAWREQGGTGERAADATALVEELGQKYGLRIGPRGGASVLAETNFRNAQKQLSTLRNQEREARQDPALSRADRAKRVEDIRGQMQVIQRDARQLHRQLVPATP